MTMPSAQSWIPACADMTDALRGGRCSAHLDSRFRWYDGGVEGRRRSAHTDSRLRGNDGEWGGQPDDTAPRHVTTCSPLPSFPRKRESRPPLRRNDYAEGECSTATDGRARHLMTMPSARSWIPVFTGMTEALRGGRRSAHTDSPMRWYDGEWGGQPDDAAPRHVTTCSPLPSFPRKRESTAPTPAQ